MLDLNLNLNLKSALFKLNLDFYKKSILAGKIIIAQKLDGVVPLNQIHADATPTLGISDWFAKTELYVLPNQTIVQICKNAVILKQNIKFKNPSWLGMS